MSDLEAKLTYVTLLNSAATRRNQLMGTGNMSKDTKEEYAKLAAREFEELSEKGNVHPAVVRAICLIGDREPDPAIQEACDAAWDVHQSYH